MAEHFKGPCLFADGWNLPLALGTTNRCPLRTEYFCILKEDLLFEIIPEHDTYLRVLKVIA